MDNVRNKWSENQHTSAIYRFDKFFSYLRRECAFRYKLIPAYREGQQLRAIFHVI